jgi:hypothetical protein
MLIGRSVDEAPFQALLPAVAFLPFLALSSSSQLLNAQRHCLLFPEPVPA